MPKSKKINKLTLVVWICLWGLSSCHYSTSIVLTPTSESPPIPSPTETMKVSSPTPTVHYQITYLSACGDEFQCMYAVEANCMENFHPCLGEPQLLFKIAKTGEGPRLPVLSSSWSPDGQRVAIEAVGLRGQGDIYVGDWAGQKWTNLTNSPYYDGDPGWSPDGQTISYTGKTGEPDNYLRAFSVTPDGKNVYRLLQLLDHLYPDTPGIAWSPDEKRVAFMHSDDQGYYQIYIANPDGSNLKQLTNRAEDHFMPRFSPDGQWLVYRRQPRSVEMVSDLYLIRPDGTGEKAVTQDDLTWKGGQSWSPNGDWIAFESKTQENSGEYRIQSAIYLMRPDGTDLTKVSQSDEDMFAPAWRVVPP